MIGDQANPLAGEVAGITLLPDLDAWDNGGLRSRRGGSRRCGRGCLTSEAKYSGATEYNFSCVLQRLLGS
jgi:hypothetical protein